MSKKAKILILVAILLLASLAAVFCVEYFVLQHPVFDRGGWGTLDSGEVCYRSYYAKPVTGWQEIDGSHYFFAEDGAMHTGWLEDGQNRYYFAADGKLQTGHLEIDGARYYLQENGTPYTARFSVSETVCFTAISPDFEVATRDARAVLPQTVNRQDAVFNLSRAALLPRAFETVA